MNKMMTYSIVPAGMKRPQALATFSYQFDRGTWEFRSHVSDTPPVELSQPEAEHLLASMPVLKHGYEVRVDLCLWCGFTQEKQFAKASHGMCPQCARKALEGYLAYAPAA